jgi:hypothetical protein
MDPVKVSAKSNPNSVAVALAGFVRERGRVEIQAIGTGALNQALFDKLPYLKDCTKGVLAPFVTSRKLKTPYFTGAPGRI